MKRIMMICAAALGILVAAVSCCKDKNKVIAIVAGPEQAVVALDIAYDAPICPNSICPEAFEVEGREVVCVKACKEGHVFVLLKPECKKACEKKCDKKCDKPCEQKCEKKCDKPCEQKCKEKCEKAGDDKCEQKCEKKCDKIAVPKICVKQVADIKDVEGNVVPAWKKAIKASDAKPACKKPCEKKCEKACEQQKPACEKKAECGQKAECGDKPECEKKPECCKAGGKPCCKEGKPECDKPCEKACEKKCEK